MLLLKCKNNTTNIVEHYFDTAKLLFKKNLKCDIDHIRI